MSRNSGVHETIVNLLSPDEEQEQEPVLPLVEGPAPLLLCNPFFLWTTLVIYILSRQGPQHVAQWATNLRPLIYGLVYSSSFTAILYPTYWTFVLKSVFPLGDETLALLPSADFMPLFEGEAVNNLIAHYMVCISNGKVPCQDFINESKQNVLETHWKCKQYNEIQ